MAEPATKEAAPKRRLDLTKPVQIDTQTKIGWLKRDFEKKGGDLSSKLYYLRELAKFGQTQYLNEVRTRYSIELESVKKSKKQLEEKRLQMSFQLDAGGYRELRRSIPNDEWEKMDEKQQKKLMMEAHMRYTAPTLAKVDAILRELEGRIDEASQIVREIEKLVPSTKIDF